MSVQTEPQTTPRRLPVASGTPALQTMGPDVELRTSNGVDGFRYTRLKGVLWTLGMLLKLPLLPLWPFFLAREARDPAIARHYFRTIAYCLKVLVLHIRFGSIMRMLKYNVLFSPDAVQRRIAQRHGACSRCAKCCIQFDCIFLGENEDSGDYFCKVYEQDYWFYGTCGRYPLDQLDIDYHACPGFSFEETHAG